MPVTTHNFRQAARQAIADKDLGTAIRKTTDLLLSRRAAAAAAHPDFAALRDWGRGRKLEISGNLSQSAETFARNVQAAGGTVHFARDGSQAARLVTRIALQRGARTAVKSKSMTAEEISLNEALETAGIEVTETDLGEFIIQLAGEKPSHILAPAIHKNRTQVDRLFHEMLGTPPGLPTEDLVHAARHALRQRFLQADLGITGANFAIAETGTLVLVTNEGNGRLTTTLPPVHVVVVGIDKIIPRLADLSGFLTLLIRSATGQTLSSYVTAITGPRKPGEEEGPEELHVILLDNGRSALAAGPFREILHCLHCGACLNHCPVYRVVGGHAYQSVYPGPMGDVLSPLLWGLDAYADLPDACTLCGRCAEACPMRIPLPQYHRRLRTLRAGRQPLKSLAAKAAAAATAHPASYGSGLKVLQWGLGKHHGVLAPRAPVAPLMGWTICRELPRPQPQPGFRTWWRHRGGGQ